MHIEKNRLESFLKTLLMNDKSKDTTKARQDLKNLGIRSELWLSQNKNEKCLKPHAKYSFTPDNKKMFCQFIKGVKLPDGFGSNFKHKVTDNDSNITGMKSHDCHIMMKRLLLHGLQQYLHIIVGKPIIKLCSFFKQICSRTLMEDHMDLEGGPIPYQWMYLFERSIGKRSVIQLDQQELKKVIWYVLYNSLEIDTYRAKFKSEFSNHNMKKEFLAGLGRSCDERRTNQNNVIFSPGKKDEELYYGQLEEILEFSYMSFKVVLFRDK
nr:hypothetical protein [Tanacetum cinerariifolium]